MHNLGKILSTVILLGIGWYGPSALGHVQCRVSLPFGGWTEGCPHVHEDDFQSLFRFKVRNACAKAYDMRVSVRYLPIPGNCGNGCSDLSSGGRGGHSDSWVTLAWNIGYHGTQGPAAYLFDTTNRYVYLSATAKNTRGGNLNWSEQRINMGSRFRDFYYNLTCN